VAEAVVMAAAVLEVEALAHAAVGVAAAE
jgi:hypothetical protein